MHHALITYTFLSSFTQLLHDLCVFFLNLVTTFTRLVFHLFFGIFKRENQLSILPTYSPPSTPPTESPNAFDSGGNLTGTCILNVFYAISPMLVLQLFLKPLMVMMLDVSPNTRSKTCYQNPAGRGALAAHKRCGYLFTYFQNG